MFDNLRLLALESKRKGLEHQLEQLRLSTKQMTPDNLNRIAKVGFELANTNIKIHSLKTKPK